MDPQFLHWQGYTRYRRPAVMPGGRRIPTEQRWSARQVIDEGLRLEGSCNHVEVPRLPHVLSVNPPIPNPFDFADWIERTMDRCREAHG
ncbi:MAG: hypothetical protein M3Z21_06390, partial [Pseudomonadota bacterium]|nr:hypothetical protein [Pseudomonadota bacterium]